MATKETNESFAKVTQLLEALTGKPLDESQALSLAAASLPLLSSLNALFEIDVQGIEPKLPPVWKEELK